MVLPFAALVPISSAVLGGYEGYRRSGGDIGATALAAGLGAAAPGALRMAGTAFGATPMGAAALAKGSQLLAKGAQLAKIPGPVAPLTAAGLGAATAGIGSLVAPQLAGSIASAAAPPARGTSQAINPAAQTALGYAAYQQTPSNIGANLPYAYDQSTGTYGNIAPSGTPGDVLGPMGLGRSLEAQRQARAELEAINILKPTEMAYTDLMRRRDFTRQAAMKGIAQNIATNANMLQNAQIASMNLGQTTGEGISRALGQVYQYQ